MTTGGRHKIRLVQSSRPVEPRHWQRDTSYHGELVAESVEQAWRTLRHGTAGDMWNARYPLDLASRFDNPRSNHLDTTSLPSHRDTSAPVSVDVETCQDWLERTSSSGSQSTDGQLSSTSRSLRGHAFNEVRAQLAGHFDPSFLTLDVSPDQYAEGTALLVRGLAAYEAPETIALRRQIADFDKKVKVKRETGLDYRESALVKLQTKLLNIVSKAMVGESYNDLHHAKDNSNGNDQSEMLFGRSFPRTRSSIVTLKTGRSDVFERPPTAEQVAAAGTVDIDRAEDNQTRISDDLACYALMILRETPIASRVYGFTACGTVFRLWCYDPLRYSSSLPCDVSPDVTDRQHAMDFCKMVALLCGPLDVLSGYWNPADQTRILLRDDPAGTTQEPGVMELTNWKPDSQRRGLIFVREQLIGRRTSTFAGKGTINGEEKDLVIKVSYLSERMRYHEQNVIKRIRDVSLQEVLRSAPPDFIFSEQDRLDLQRGRERLPHYVGTLDFSHYTGGIIESYDASTKRTKRLFLSGVVTEGRPGKVLAADTTIEQTVKVYADAERCFWTASLYGIHYRDPNQGNILLAEDGGGLLIDFGNAKLDDSRVLIDGNIDERVEALLEDARSANAYFICVASATAGMIAAIYRTDEADLDAAEQNVKTKKRELKQLQDDCKSATKRIEQFRHPRYCNDTESLLYCLIHQLGRRVGYQGLEKQLPVIADKTLLWESEFNIELRAIDLPLRTQQAFRKVIRHVKSMEDSMKQKYPSFLDTPSKPTEI